MTTTVEALLAFDAALYNRLAENSELDSKVGERVYPVVRPDDSGLPALVYTPQLSIHENTLRGSAKMTAYRVQLEAWARSYQQALEVAHLADVALRSANVGDTPLLLVSVQPLFDHEVKEVQVVLEYSGWVPG